jgi:hypothetical protein
VLTVPGPVAWTKEALGDFAQTRPGSARVSREKREMLAAQPLCMVAGSVLKVDTPKGCDLPAQPVVRDDFETEQHWPGGQPSLEKVDSRDVAAAVECNMLPICVLDAARPTRPSIEATRRIRLFGCDAGAQDARVQGGGPYRHHLRTILPWILGESAAPIRAP